ncbi:MAG: serine/threonine protein kinase [Myxococcaceae bacterium]
MNALEQSLPRVPTRIGRYRVVSRLPSSAWADAFVVRRDGASTTVVLKRVLPGLLSNPEVERSLRVELARTAQLSHPNLVRLHEYWEDSGALYLTCEHVAGHTFGEIGLALRSVRMAVDPALLCRLAASGLRGLHCAHELRSEAGTSLRFVHGDVNPEVVMVAQGGQVKVSDFGLARALLPLSAASSVYVAPELNKGVVDRRVDIYSMAVVLNGLLGSLFSARQQQAPKELDQILKIATAKDPAARYQDAAELADALTEYATRNSETPTPEELNAILSDLFGRFHGDNAEQPHAAYSVAAKDERPNSPSSTTSEEQPSEQSLAARDVPADTDTARMRDQTDVDVEQVDAPFNWRGPAFSGSVAGLIALLVTLWVVNRDSGPHPMAEPQPKPISELSPVAEPRVLDEPPEPTSLETTEETGRVLLNLRPSTEVHYAGERRGTTPMKEGLVLPSGMQTLILRDPKLGTEKRIAVVVPAGGEITVNETQISKTH